MVEPAVREDLDAAAASTGKLTLVIECTAPAPAVSGVTRRERLAEVQAQYVNQKRPFIERLRRHGAEVRDLPASPLMLVTAAIADWRDWTDDEGWLAIDHTLRVLPNDRFDALI
jgi:hypothetical protein